jgi:hypothetical protein
LVLIVLFVVSFFLASPDVLEEKGLGHLGGVLADGAGNGWRRRKGTLGSWLVRRTEYFLLRVKNKKKRMKIKNKKIRIFPPGLRTSSEG